MDSLGPVEGFKPEPCLCPEVDTLTMYFENSGSYAERVDNLLTVFKSFENQDIVGFELKGILGKMKQLGDMIIVKAQTPKVNVRLILMAYLADAPEHRDPYQEVLRRSERFSNANVPVMA